MRLPTKVGRNKSPVVDGSRPPLFERGVGGDLKETSFRNPPKSPFIRGGLQNAALSFMITALLLGCLCTAALSFVVPVLQCFCPAIGLPLSTCGVAWAAAEGGVSVQAQVEKDSVSVGEPFVLQIRVEGGDIAPGTEQPDVSGLRDFAVEVLGGRNNNSSSITIINGKVNKIESHGYVYSYRLTPRKTGELEIPPIAVPLDEHKSKIVTTQPITIKVGEPEATDDFHLELKFSKTNFYIGEPVVLTVVWYLGKDVESVTFNLPILQDQAFSFLDPKADQEPRKQYFQIPIGGTNILAEKGTGIHNGREYTTFSFRKVLFARKPGSFEAPEATVSCKALVGYSRQQKRRSPLDGFFDDDFFNSARKGVYKTVVARAHPVILTALALPEDGRPPGFSGWVGRFHLGSSANPTEVSVGDPITLTLTVSGSDYLDNVELPLLARDPQLEKDFKIPDEMAAGITRGDVKQFTQTLRPRSAEVKAIPPIKISYFDPDARRYEIAESNPIALTVKPARVLTSADVEGKAGGTAVKKSELENWSQGIAHNYEGPEVLERQAYRVSSIVRSPLWLALTFAPLLSFAALLVYIKVRQRHLADPGRLRSGKASVRFKQRVASIGTEGLRDSRACAALLDAIRNYLGDRLGSAGSAQTFADVAGKLEEKGITVQLAERLRDLFDACERGSYGGLELHKPVDDLVREAIDVVRLLNRAV
jgi:hypothetical protein